MKVQCTSSISPHVSDGRTYTVLEIYDDMTRIIDDGGAPALYPSAAFRLIDDKVDRDWVRTVDADGSVRHCHLDFVSSGLFEDLFDRNEEALGLLQGLISVEHDERARLLSWFDRDGNSSR